MCWSYALEWRSSEVQARMARADISGPLFLSVGQPAQLKEFLSALPEFAGSMALVDTSEDFEVYHAAGFNQLLGDKMLDEVPDFKPPTNMGPRKWFTYMRNAITLAPIRKDKTGEERIKGVKVLGGTYAIDGANVKFSHQDLVPGATPSIDDVLRSLGA